ncbi:cupin domain-containing protein [Persephonella sp.]
MGSILKPEGVFNEEKPYAQPAYTGSNFKMVYFHLKAGQKIPLHTSTSEVIVTVVKGRGNFFAGSYENATPVSEGESFYYESEEPHGFEAVEDMIVQAIITPVPNKKIQF